MALETRPDADTAPRRGAGDRATDLDAAPVAIEVRGLEKVFRIPAQRISRLKERLVRPLARQEYRRLHALRDVSFDVRSGEFFGIVGRNGSGKSSLLKVMASIYRADAGSVRMAGSVAPFIELGVGFDPELSARDNVVLNAVMMGMTPSEARRRLGAVIEFAELEEFVDLKLKNYSSGMLVRLAFAVMVQADTDILLIDEVLAVGDAAFQQKCADVFQGMRKEGKTIVLVTHDMTAVEKYCHRAMLLSDGRVVEIGDPGQVARRYLRLNFERHHEQAGQPSGDDSAPVRVLDIWLEGRDGQRRTSFEQDESIRICAELEALRGVPGAQFGFVVATADDIAVHEFVGQLSDSPGGGDMEAGRKASITVDLQNRLAPGRYYIHFGVTRDRNRKDVVLHLPHLLGFLVYGDQVSTAVVGTDYEMQISPEPGEEG